MKKKGYIHIADCWQKFFEKHAVEPDDFALRRLFEEYVGPKLAKHAQVVKVSRGTVYVRAESAVVRNEISLMRKKILKAMNEALGVKGGKNTDARELKKLALVQ